MTPSRRSFGRQVDIDPAASFQAYEACRPDFLISPFVPVAENPDPGLMTVKHRLKRTRRAGRTGRVTNDLEEFLADTPGTIMRDHDAWPPVGPGFEKEVQISLAMLFVWPPVLVLLAIVLIDRPGPVHEKHVAFGAAFNELRVISAYGRAVMVATDETMTASRLARPSPYVFLPSNPNFEIPDLNALINSSDRGCIGCAVCMDVTDKSHEPTCIYLRISTAGQ